MNESHDNALLSAYLDGELTAGEQQQVEAWLASDQQALIDQMNALLSRMDRWDELLDAINQLTKQMGGMAGGGKVDAARQLSAGGLGMPGLSGMPGIGTGKGSTKSKSRAKNRPKQRKKRR